MLQSIRNRAQGLVVGVLVVFIIITFAFWGIQRYLRAAGEVVVADVNGVELSLRRFQNAYQDYRRQLQAMMGDKTDIRQLDQELIKNQALQQMINNELLRQTAQDMHLRISDEQLAQLIQSTDSFLQDGRFSNDLYESRLRQIGMTPQGFEQQLRRDLLNQQIQRGIADTSFVTPHELEEFRRLESQKRDFRYVTIPSTRFQDEVSVTDDEIRARYEQNPDDYMTPETVRVAYIDLSLEELSKQVATDESTLRDYYERNKEKFTTAEERSASHILVQVDRDAPPEEIEAARKKAIEYRNMTLSGKSFEEIAREYSDDVGSKAQGGETGFFKKGVMAPEFDDIVFSMEPGEISEPIQTDFGFHIIRLNKIKPGGLKPFEEVRDDVAHAYRLAEAEKMFYEQAELLANLTFETPDSLKNASEALGLPVIESKAFDRSGGPGILGRPEVIEAAFSTEVVIEGLNSEPIELDDSRVVVLRNLEHKPSVLRPLEEVRDSIEKKLRAEKLKQLSYQYGRKLLSRLQSGEAVEALSKAEQLDWEQAQDVDRNAPDVNRAIVRQAFKLTRPEPGTAVYGGVPMGTGDYALIELTAVHEEQAQTDAPEHTTDILRDRLTRVHGAVDWREFLDTVEASADVKTYPGNL